jgi:hypothetical protein
MDFFRLRSFNEPRHFIRHRNFLAELTIEEGPPDEFLFAFERQPGHDRVLLRAKSVPMFLRHRDLRLRLEQPDGPADRLFFHDATFEVQPGLADPNGISFRATNLPGHYIRHRDFHLFVDPEDSPNLAADATFFTDFPSVLIDPGTALEGAEG